MKNNLNSVLSHADSYKLSHKGFMPNGVEKIYSNMTPRTSKYFPTPAPYFDGKAVFFGLQFFIKEYLIEEWNREFFSKPKEQVIKRFKRRTDTYLGTDSVSMKHFEELYDLGYLPISIKALPEGAAVPMKVPFLTIVNTNDKFAWLTNYLETVLSCSIWKPTYTATLVKSYRVLIEAFARDTVGNYNHVPFQLHGFEFRGMSGRHDAAIAGAGLLLSSCGTDTIPAIDLLEDYYNANSEKEFIAASVPASEHSLASLGTSLDSELEFFRDAITKYYPTGIVSLVSDTYDFFRVVTEFATILKEDILHRKVNAIGFAKVVFRPDSGDPVKIVCGEDIEILDNDKRAMEYATSLEKAGIWVAEGLVDKHREETPHGECGDGEISKLFKYNSKSYKITVEIDWNRYDKQYYFVESHKVKSIEEITLTPEQKGAVECLYDIFGGTISDKGYKVLHERTGLIYGDGMKYETMQAILQGLKNKGFASSNCLFGIGSFSMTLCSRDSLGVAQKATWAQVNGKGIEIYKDPKTDTGMKKSAKGLLRVDLVDGEYVLRDCVSKEEESGGELKEVFRDGKLLVDHTLAEIRARVNESVTKQVAKI